MGNRATYSMANVSLCALPSPIRSPNSAAGLLFLRPLPSNDSNTVSSVFILPTPLCRLGGGLLSIPDKLFIKYLLQGIANGFRIGFRHGSQLRPVHRNLKFDYDNPQVITDYFKQEVQLGCIQVVPTSTRLALQLLQVSPFPQKHKSAPNC